MPSPNPPVPFHQAQQLAAMGMEQDNWPQLVWCIRPMHEWRLAYLTSALDWHPSHRLAAPDTVSALLWLEESGIAVSVSYTGRQWFGHMRGKPGEGDRVWKLDTTTDLLDLMLKETADA